MARWQNHYELALRGALEERGETLLPVDEFALADDGARTIKNFDFLWLRPDGPHWLVEVKGRRASPSPNAWATMSDIASLDGWRSVLGPGFEPVLVFVFGEETAPSGEAWRDGPGGGVATATAHRTRRLTRVDFAAGGWSYSAHLLPLAAFQARARLRSAKWRTLNLPAAAFREHTVPFAEWFGPVAG